MVPWEQFARRRKLKMDRFVSHYEIRTRGDLLETCRRIGVQPPGEDIISELFPKTIEMPFEGSADQVEDVHAARSRASKRRKVEETLKELGQEDEQ